MRKTKQLASCLPNSALNKRKTFRNSPFSHSLLPPSSATNIFSSQQFDQQFNSHSSIHPFITAIRKFSTTTLNLNQSSGVSYFPYGEPDFASIRRNKQFYVDKTHLIPLLEKRKQLFFVRPPRWGKSLLLSMLHSYYDINSKEKFDVLFGGLWIGNPKNQTPLRNEYHVLHLDFSIDVVGSPENIKVALHKVVNSTIADFVKQYGLNDVDIDPTDALVSFDNLVYCLRRNNLKLMVLIDEYDRFANKLMFENPDNYKLIVEGKRGDPASSPIRAFFERLKKASGAGLMDFRSFITGITPIALADASGYNVASNISQLEEFGDLVGFTENDLRTALNNIGIVDDHQDNAIMVMKRFYNGYHFPGSTQPLFSPTLSMYCLQKLMSKSQFKSAVFEGKDITLEDMMDENTNISENVFSTLATSSAAIPIIQQLTSTNIIQFNTSIVRSFKLREILDPPTNEENKNQIWDNTLSFMYYHGMLTFSKDIELKNLTIPNEIAQQQYFSELINITSLTQHDFALLYKYPSLDIVKKILGNIIGDRYMHYNNYFSGGALQHAIYCVLEAYFKRGPSYFKVTTEDTINQNEDTDFDQRTDVILESDKDIIIFELKRIRPNGLKWDEHQMKHILKRRTKSKSKITIKWYTRTMRDVLSGRWKIARTVQRINEGLSELLENELINLPLNEAFLFEEKPKGGEVKTVRYVVEKATRQLTDYVKLLKETKKYSKPIHAFVVVQVGTPIIVRKIDVSTL
ncbi:hypothetical protein C9374_000909 [Naegleria lovaniensis]|uniref:AAA-ATPase-like domain-containing protein n=1 Tax=Naegleria lovaniensis TaxID=51637 RepID=A0AA88KNI5_NAELO|nr:uncharacterized protein C9374_000909 [Naegleria lovaniensis]KAG2388059.1 hypothetical protein C9374_000909 [Naegleria lovaniensis]